MQRAVELCPVHKVLERGRRGPNPESSFNGLASAFGTPLPCFGTHRFQPGSLITSYRLRITNNPTSMRQQHPRKSQTPDN